MDGSLRRSWSLSPPLSDDEDEEEDDEDEEDEEYEPRSKKKGRNGRKKGPTGKKKGATGQMRGSAPLLRGYRDEARSAELRATPLMERYLVAVNVTEGVAVCTSCGITVNPHRPYRHALQHHAPKRHKRLADPTRWPDPSPMLRDVQELFTHSPHPMPPDHLPPERLYTAREAAVADLQEGQEPRLPAPVLGFPVFAGCACRSCGKFFTGEASFRDHCTRRDEHGNRTHHEPYRTLMLDLHLQRFSLFPPHQNRYAPVSLSSIPPYKYETKWGISDRCPLTYTFHCAVVNALLGRDHCCTWCEAQSNSASSVDSVGAGYMRSGGAIVLCEYSEHS